ncbi:hypothetical protein LV779_29105 [Streptomyces thinghirensis]|nr:hypothetical protein [Streptomyces thinghirensis]
MPADRPGPPEPLPRLADILGQGDLGRPPDPAGAGRTPLAGSTDGAARGAGPADSGGSGSSGGRDGTPGAGTARAPGDAGAARAGRTTPAGPAAEPSPVPEARTPLRLPSPAPAPGSSAVEPHSALLAPAPPMLRHTLALQRSLRPLKRRTDAPVGHEVDEAATADRIARLGAGPEWWLPVLRPVRERWLRLNLVHDAGPTMPVWQPLGARTARHARPVGRLPHGHPAPRGTRRHRPRRGAGGARRRPYRHPADQRLHGTAVARGPAGTRWFGTLRRWARRTPLAVLQPLPEQLWRDTALPPVPGRLSAPHRAAPSASLAFTPYDDGTAPPGARRDRARTRTRTGTRVAGELGHWSRARAAPSTRAPPPHCTARCRPTPTTVRTWRGCPPRSWSCVFARARRRRPSGWPATSRWGVRTCR